MMERRGYSGTPAERGASLVVVVVVLVVVLIAGLAAIAVTSGQLSRSRGFRTRAATEACARAGLSSLRANLPNIPTFDATEGTLSGSNVSLTYRAGHYDGDGASTVEILDPTEFDASALFVGENITNVLGVTGSGDLSTGLNVVRMTSVCGGSGYGRREAELILKVGVATGVR